MPDDISEVPGKKRNGEFGTSAAIELLETLIFLDFHLLVVIYKANYSSEKSCTAVRCSSVGDEMEKE